MQRQACLKQQFAHLYPTLPAGEWQEARILAAAVRSAFRRSATDALDCRLDEAHFEFRGGRPRSVIALVRDEGRLAS